MTAHEVKGKVDYKKLCEQFGCSLICPQLVERIERVTGVEAHPFLKRGVFYAHRDLEQLLDMYEAGKKFYLYTGMPQPLLQFRIHRFAILRCPASRCLLASQSAATSHYTDTGSPGDHRMRLGALNMHNQNRCVESRACRERPVAHAVLLPPSSIPSVLHTLRPPYPQKALMWPPENWCTR